MTLGIMFVCLVVLSFASLILRNAENSDIRLAELSSVDRLYTLSSSLERSVSRSYFSLTGINLTLNNDTITIAKDTQRKAGSPNYYQPPEFIDPVILSMKTSDAFVQLLAESLTYNTTTLSNSLGLDLINYLILTFYYPLYSPDPTKSFLIYSYTDAAVNLTQGAVPYNFRHKSTTQQYCCFEINNNTPFYPINSTYQTAFMGNNLSQLKEIHIKARHPERCPVINWSGTTTGRLSSTADPAKGEVNIKIVVTTESAKYPCTPAQSAYYLDTQSNAILNRTLPETSLVTFPQVIFFDNLTNDPNYPGYDFITPYGEVPPASASKERPVAFIYDTVKTGLASNALYLVQYDNPLQWEVVFQFTTGPVEIYSTETVTSALPSLNISRVQRPVRFK